MAKLNLQEKRRIEDLIFSEFDSAIREYRDRRSEECSLLEAKLLKNPPASVLRLREDIVKLETQVNTAEKQIREKKDELEKAGYSLRDSEEKELRLVSYGITKRKELKDFDSKSDEIRQKIEQLKKRYVLMVYSDSEEVKGLFDKASAELQKIVG